MSSENHVGKIIKAARKKKGVSAAALGSLLDPPMTYGAIYAYEAGKNKPNAEVVAQISKILEIDVRSFFPSDQPSVSYAVVGVDDETNENVKILGDCYRKMDDAQRSAILTVAKAMVE